MQHRLHTIARRDRAAEAVARCNDSPARPVSGLVSALQRRVAPSRVIDAVVNEAIRLTDLPLRGQCRL